MKDAVPDVRAMKAAASTVKDWASLIKGRVGLVKDKVSERIKQRSGKRSKRVLVHEIMSIQVISAALIGALAVASLYWGGTPHRYRASATRPGCGAHPIQGWHH